MPDDHSSYCRIIWSCATCLESGTHECGSAHTEADADPAEDS
jgi:hypothetical protein